MNFESEAEKISSEIFMKKSFIVEKRKVTEPVKPSSKAFEEVRHKKIREEKVGENMVSELKWRIKIHEKGAVKNTIQKVLF